MNRFLWLPILFVLLMPTSDVRACPFCSAQGTTFSGEVSTAHFIVVGTVTGARHDPRDFSKGTTDVTIETVVKPNEWLAGRKVLTIPRFIPPDADGKPIKMLLFCELHTAAMYTAAAGVIGAPLLADPRIVVLDAYRGEQLGAESKLADYLKGAFEVRSKDAATRLRYFFDYLDNAELQVSVDALNEFASADYVDVRPTAEKLPAAKVLSWIKSPGTPQSRLGLYGLILGHCGSKADAAELRALLDKNDNQFAGGLDGILAAYVMLDHVEGWKYLKQLLADPKADQSIRYAVLKVFRFFWDYRSDLVPKEMLLDGMKRIVLMPEMADLAIDDLRKWSRWDQTDLILGLTDAKDHMKEAMNRRAILKFALATPSEKLKAKEYVAKIRKEDPDRVKYVEQALQDEITPLPPKPTAKKQ